MKCTWVVPVCYVHVKVIYVQVGVGSPRVDPCLLQHAPLFELGLGEFQEVVTNTAVVPHNRVLDTLSYLGYHVVV